MDTDKPFIIALVSIVLIAAIGLSYAHYTDSQVAIEAMRNGYEHVFIQGHGWVWQKPPTK